MNTLTDAFFKGLMQLIQDLLENTMNLWKERL